MDVAILGPLEVRERGRVVPLGGLKQRALLAILAIHANKVVSADALVDLLWTDQPPASARHSLHVYVSQLRDVLGLRAGLGTGRAVLHNQPPGYVLRLQSRQLDVNRFEGLIEEAKAAERARDHRAAAKRFRAALALWRGPALAEFSGEPWARREASRLNEMRLSAIEDGIDAGLALGQHAEVVPELEALIEENPFREKLRAQLMLALYRSGRQGEASAAYQQTRELLVNELGMEPGRELQELLGSIVRHDTKLDDQEPGGTPTRSTLPIPLTSFIGREEEVRTVKRMLRRCRLLTLIGIGGIGKTRLALTVASEVANSYPGAVWLVDFSSLSAGDQVDERVATSLGLRMAAGKTYRTQLLERIGSQRMLFVFDNCENVLKACASLVATLLGSCPNLDLLATSREPLHVPGERKLAVAPLALPPIGTSDHSSIWNSEAVQLFADRAGLDWHSSHLRDRAAEEIAQICVRLDGIPLALELAAARAELMSLSEINKRLDERFDLLRASPNELSPQQNALYATIDWSYWSLSDIEKALFRRSSVFSGGFTLAACEHVCSGRVVARGDVLDALGGLCDKSLVNSVRDPSGSVRFRELETVREYARAKLAESGDLDEFDERHAEYYAQFAADAKSGLEGPNGDSWFDLVLDELANLGAAFEHAVSKLEARGLRIPWLLLAVWLRGPIVEGRKWTARGVAATEWATDDTNLLRVRAELITAAAGLASQVGVSAEALALANEAVRICRRLNAVGELAWALQMVAITLSRNGDLAAALSPWQESAVLMRQAHDDRGLGLVLTNIGDAVSTLGDLDRGRKLIEEAIASAEHRSDAWLAMAASTTLAEHEVRNGEYAAAKRRFRHWLPKAGRSRDALVISTILKGVAAIEYASGANVRALQLLAGAGKMEAAMGIPSGMPNFQAVREGAAKAVGKASAASVWQSGERMEAGELIALALSDDVGGSSALGVQHRRT